MPSLIAQTHSQQHAPPSGNLMGGDYFAIIAGVVVAIFGWFVRRVISEQDEKIKSLALKADELSKADLLISEEISQVRLDMSQNYVTKEMFLHAVSVLSAKMDSMGECLKGMSIDMQVMKELRQRENGKRVSEATSAET
jgi:hypothetical protein